MKNIPLAIIAAAILSSAGLVFGTTAYDNLVLSNTPAAYWPLQDTSGPTIQDIGGGSHNGTLMTSTDGTSLGSDQHTAFTAAASGSTDGATYLLGGPGGLTGISNDTAIYFTNLNTSVNNTHIVVPYSSAFDPSGAFTAEAWVNLPIYPIGYTSNAYQVPLGLEANGGTQYGWFFAVKTDLQGASRGDFYFNLARSSHSGWNGPATVNLGGTWLHAVQVYDGTNLFCYTNGVLLQEIPNPTYGNEASGGAGTETPFIIGSYCSADYQGIQAAGYGRANFWQGGVSHVAIYAHALTANQVANDYSMGILGPQVVAPTILTQPAGVTNYVNYGASLSVSAGGSGLHYQWYQNLTQLPGQTNFTLTFNSLVSSNAGTYFVNVTNAGGGTNSANAVVGVLPLPSDAYQSNVISMLPVAFYPMHDTGPAVSGITPCVDLISYNGANDSALYVAADNATVPTLGVAGPGGSSDLGTGVTLSGTIPNGAVVTNATAMSISGNSTMEVWIQVSDYADAQNIIMHGPSVEANPSKSSDYLGFDGFGDYYVGRYQQTAATNYTYAFYGANTPTTPTPTAPASDMGQWVHLVGTSDGVAWHLYRNAQEVANLPDTNGAIAANGGWAIGARNSLATLDNVIIPDCIPGAAPNFTTNGTGLTATINNVALYNYALSPGKILAHYQIGLTGHTSPVTNNLTITSAGSNATLTWNYGTIQTASSPRGPWTDVVAVSPYMVGETNTAFYRAVIKY